MQKHSAQESTWKKVLLVEGTYIGTAVMALNKASFSSTLSRTKKPSVTPDTKQHYTSHVTVLHSFQCEDISSIEKYSVPRKLKNPLQKHFWNSLNMHYGAYNSLSGPKHKRPSGRREPQEIEGSACQKNQIKKNLNQTIPI